jgi:hypothetical protein
MVISTYIRKCVPDKKQCIFESKLDIRPIPAIVFKIINTYHIKQNSPGLGIGKPTMHFLLKEEKRC